MLKTYRDNTNWDLTWPEWCLNCDVVRDASNSRLQLTKNIGEMVKLQGDVAWIPWSKAVPVVAKERFDIN